MVFLLGVGAAVATGLLFPVIQEVVKDRLKRSSDLDAAVQQRLEDAVSKAYVPALHALDGMLRDWTNRAVQQERLRQIYDEHGALLDLADRENISVALESDAAQRHVARTRKRTWQAIQSKERELGR